MDRTSIVISFIFGLLVIASFSGCLAKEESDRFMTEELSDEYEASQNTTLKVMNLNGYT